MGLFSFDKSQDPNSIQINDSRKTIFAMVNSMVGGIILVLPLMVLKTGILLSIVILLCTGFISCFTFQIVIRNMNSEEFDFQEIIQRIMGKRWAKYFNALGSFYLFLVCILYYYLIIAAIFSISVSSMAIAGVDRGLDSFCCANSSDITVDKFSETWITIVMFIPMTLLIFIKDFKYLVKMSEIGVYAIYSYVVFIIYLYFKNYKDIGNYWDNKYLYQFESGELLSSILLGFQIQSTSVPIMKFNKNQKNNKRDVNITFGIAALAYTVIGLLGGMAVLVLGQGNIGEAQTILDFFGATEFTPIIIECMYLGHLISVYPIFWQLVKSRAYEILYGPDDKPNKGLDYAINIVFIILVTLLKNLPGLDISIITSVNGAFSCFFLIILFPVFMDISTFKTNKGMVPRIKSIIKSFGFNKFYDRDIAEAIKQQEIKDQQGDQIIQKNRRNHPLLLCFYGLLIIYGLFVMVYGLYISFAAISDSTENKMQHHSLTQNMLNIESKVDGFLSKIQVYHHVHNHTLH